MPRDKDGVDRHEAEGPSQRACVEHRHLAEANDGDIQDGTALHQSWLLEVADNKGVVALLLCLNCIADCLVRAAELSQRAQIAIWGRDPVDLKADGGRGIRRQVFLESIYVGTLIL